MLNLDEKEPVQQIHHLSVEQIEFISKLPCKYHDKFRKRLDVLTALIFINIFLDVMSGEVPNQIILYILRIISIF